MLANGNWTKILLKSLRQLPHICSCSRTYGFDRLHVAFKVRIISDMFKIIFYFTIVFHFAQYRLSISGKLYGIYQINCKPYNAITSWVHEYGNINRLVALRRYLLYQKEKIYPFQWNPIHKNPVSATHILIILFSPMEWHPGSSFVRNITHYRFLWIRNKAAGCWSNSPHIQ